MRQGIGGDIKKEIPLLDTAATDKPEQKEQKEEAADQDPDRMPTTRSGKGTHKSTSHSDNQPSHSEQSLAKSTRSDINTGGHDKIARHPHISPDEQDLQQKAAAVVLVARLEMFSVCINGFGDEAAKINYAKAITSQSQPNSVHDVPPGTSNPGPRKVQQQLKRLVPSSSIHNDDNHHHGMSPPDRSSREVGTGRLGNIYAWWDRHNSHSGKYIGRDMVDHGDMSVDCPKQGQTLQSEASKKELDAWRASLGLFWVAAGHWLDDSRTVSSYHLQPQDLLELQFRDHYIHLPNYKDHYAEGVIFKLSKKSRPVSMLTSHGGKESLGVWKERWIVLQGSKLLIYHKRKDMNHWIRIFNSLNNNTGPLTSPTSLNTRIGSPNLGSSYPMSSSIPDSSRSHASALASYPSERKRNHTLNNMFSNSAATMPSIDPVVISNAEVAISSMNSSSNNGHGNNSNGANYSNSNHHYRNVSQTTNISSSALDNRDLNLLQHHPLTTSTKEDTRRRAITEPNRFRPLNAQHSRGNTKNAPKTALEVDTSRSLDLSSVSEAPFRLDSPPGSRKRRPVLGTECLDSASQALLATSSARSSMALIYSGYVWIYVPNVPFTTGEMKEESNGQQNRQSDLLSKDTVLDISATSPMSSSRTFVDHTNNSGGSASASAGRYVKCFATINDHGHLHWVEVKKQNDLESEQELGSKLKGTPSRSYYGIQLKPKKLAEAEGDMDQRSLNGNVSVESCPLSPESISGTLKPSTELIQVSVAHRLRLFFFCIKVTPSALTEVLLNIAEATTGLAIPATGSRNNTSPSITSTATNVAAKIRHRLSSSLSTLATSGLPPLPSMKPQSLSGSVSKGKNMGRPSMTSPHDRELTSVAHHSQQQQQQHQQRQQHQQSQSLHPDRAMSASSESVRPVSHKSSSMSLKSTLSNITTAPAMVGGSSPLLFPSKDGDQQQQHSQFASPTSAEPASPSSSSSSSSSSSNVLSLAQNLQKAVLMNRGQSVSSDGCPGSNGDGSEEHSAAQLAQSSPSSSTNRKLTLSEVTVANQPALPDSAETLEQARSLQEQTVQQRFQRAEERSRAKSQQYNLQQHHQQSQQQQYRQQQQHFQSQEPSKIRSDTSNSESINSACPFLEMNEDVDGSGESFVTLKGYTETEDGWRAWQSALERFLDGPIREQNSALPPEDTLIPSYHSPPEVQLSEKAQRFLSAKESLIGEVNLAVVEVGRAPTPDIMSAGAIPTLNDPTTQTRATSSSLTRWMHLSGGGGAGGAGGGGSVDRGDKNKRSAGELSKVMTYGDKESGSASGHHHNHSGQTLYSTATAMMHSVSAGGIGNNLAHSCYHDNNNSSNSDRLKPVLKGSRGPSTDEEDCHQSTHSGRSGNSSGKEKDTSAVAAALASLSLPPKPMGHYFSPSPKAPASPNPGYTSALGDGQVQEESRSPLLITATSTQLVGAATIMSTSVSEGLLIREAADDTVDDEAKDRMRRSSLYSLYSRTNLFAVREGGESSGSGTGFTHGRARMSDQELTLAGLEVESSDPADNSQLSVGDDHLPDDASDVVEYPSEGGGGSAFAHLPIEEPTATTSASEKMRRPPGSSHNNKKHQTVLGASKAAVSGVFGKFRKSVG
ncbi:hypothetical protein BGZ58_004340 [Dissophora ornata]|nr:hypothetical protein BGZ58_004340 [Dissophora ornata]